MGQTRYQYDETGYYGSLSYIMPADIIISNKILNR